MASKLLTLHQTAERIGRSPNTVRYWLTRDQGEAPKSFKVGRRRMFREEDVEHWIDAHEQAVPAA